MQTKMKVWSLDYFEDYSILIDSIPANASKCDIESNELKMSVIAYIQQNHCKTKEMFRSKIVFELTAYLKFTKLHFPLSLLSN